MAYLLKFIAFSKIKY